MGRKQTKASAYAAGRTVTKSTPAISKGGSYNDAKSGRQQQGSVSIDGRKLAFRKINNADPGPKV